jgi:murein DD-endopeptidase MepM/ murein hydrolase activator NlpD
LASQESDYAKITDRMKRLKAINEQMRLKNEALIHKYSQKVTPFQGSWNIERFYPLHGAKRVSDFGVTRYYYYKKRDNIISTSYHVGYDFASIKNDKIYSSSPGTVVFASYNGIYGNMPMIDHGFGLYTLYGHCNKVLVKVGQKVKAHEVIGRTGKSGLALGDHLHFGILVQGVEVYPLEWMNKKWIKDYIMAVFQKADKKIGYN